MQNLINQNENDYSALVDISNSIADLHEQLAELERKKFELETKEQKLYDPFRIHAARVFQENVIAEIHAQAKRELKTEPFNKEEYIKEFSDSQSIDIEHILWMLEVCRKIMYFGQKNNDQESPEELSWLVRLANTILSNREGKNHD